MASILRFFTPPLDRWTRFITATRSTRYINEFPVRITTTSTEILGGQNRMVWENVCFGGASRCLPRSYRSLIQRWWRKTDACAVVWSDTPVHVKADDLGVFVRQADEILCRCDTRNRPHPVYRSGERIASPKVFTKGNSMQSDQTGPALSPTLWWTSPQCVSKGAMVGGESRATSGSW